MSDLALDTIEGTGADEEDLLGVYLDHLLVGVLTSALRGDVDDRPFEELEEALLDPFATDVARDGGIVPLTCDLVDLIDEDDPTLCGSDVLVGYLQEACQQTLDILAHIASLRQHSSIDDREGYLQ